MNILYIMGTIIGTVAGQISIKYGVTILGKSQEISSLSWFQFIIKALLNGYIILGFALAFTASIFWIFAMRTLPLSFAYPFTAMNIILATLLGFLIFKETLPPYFWASLLMIIGGLILMGMRTPTT